MSKNTKYYVEYCKKPRYVGDGVIYRVDGFNDIEYLKHITSKTFYVYGTCLEEKDKRVVDLSHYIEGKDPTDKPNLRKKEIPGEIYFAILDSNERMNQHIDQRKNDGFRELDMKIDLILSDSAKIEPERTWAVQTIGICPHL